MEGDEFVASLEGLGFRLLQRDRRTGVSQFARQPNRFLTEWVHDLGDEALFTWEFDFGGLCDVLAWRMSGSDPILYPQYDARIARDGEAVVTEITRLESSLRALDLADPSL